MEAPGLSSVLSRLFRLGHPTGPALLATLGGTPPDTLQGQAAPPSDVAPVVAEVGSQPSCARCRIELEPVVLLGDDDGEGMLEDRPYAVATDSRGRYYVVGRYGNDQVPRLFDQRGRYLRRLGRSGAGPGEFRGADALLIVHDSVFVFDVGNGRLSVLSPTFEPIRVAPIPTTTYSAAVSGRTVFVHAWVRDRARVGLPLHRMDLAGNYLGSHGDSSLAVLPSQLPIIVRLTASRGGGVWSTRATGEFRLEQWDANGKLLRSLRRRADWFPRYEKPWNATPSRAPAPAIAAVWEDSLGRLWVVGLASDPGWKQGLGKAIVAEGRTIYPVLDDSRIYDAVVEVIDPVAGRVVATRRFDPAIELAIGSGLFSSVVRGPAGVVKVQVWRLTLNDS